MNSDSVSGCEGKRRIDDQQRAKEIAKQSSRRHDVKMSTYRCKCYGFWHIGQRDQFQKTKKTRRTK